MAGIFGYAGVFRSRPNTPLSGLALGLGAGIAVLAGLFWLGIRPFYLDLCPADTGGTAALAGPCYQFFAGDGIDPLFVAIGVAIAAILTVTLITVVVRLLRNRDLGVVFVLVAGPICGVISAFIAAPIAALVFGGVTGSGTDLLVAAFQYAGSDLQTAVLQQSLISDSIDKTVEFLVVFAILGALSRRMAARFPQGERALGTIEA